MGISLGEVPMRIQAAALKHRERVKGKQVLPNQGFT